MGTITKALALLDLFSRTRPEIGLTDFVKLTQWDKATVHRHLVELEGNGFLSQDPDTRAYRLGPSLFRLSTMRELTHPKRAVIGPLVKRMADELGELVHCSLLDKNVLRPLSHADPEIHGTQVHFDVTEDLPMHATSSGHAVLAFSKAEFLNSILSQDLTAYTAKTVTAPAIIKEQLAEVRQCGVSRVEQAFDDEVSSQAVPIFGPAGDVVGSLSVAVPSVRATEDKCCEAAKVLSAHVLQATHALGGVIPQEYLQKWYPK